MRLHQKGLLFLYFISLMHISQTTYAQNDIKQTPPLPDSTSIETQFQRTVSGGAIPIEIDMSRPIRIALVYPSSDVSDFWIRNFKAMVKRLDELRIPYQTKEFSSKQIEHALQTRYTDEILASDEPYDFVIFGPSELEVQETNIQRLANRNDFRTFIWAFHTPKENWAAYPDAWFDFSSSMGAKVLCRYVVDTLGDDVYFAMNRGIPGVTDDQRSQEFSDCVEQEGNWLNMYEHFGQYQPKGGADGAILVAKNFPEVSMLHNANTAMTIGSLDALAKLGKLDDIFVTGWGGTAKEIDKIKSGELNATPMRMSDDLGVATAEAIKLYLESRPNEVPRIYLGRITVVSSQMPQSQIDSLSREAFRYSGREE